MFRVTLWTYRDPAQPPPTVSRDARRDKGDGTINTWPSVPGHSAIRLKLENASIHVKNFKFSDNEDFKNRNYVLSKLTIA